MPTVILEHLPEHTQSKIPSAVYFQLASRLDNEQPAYSATAASDGIASRLSVDHEDDAPRAPLLLTG